MFWGFVLGPVGAILSVPMTMIVRLALDSSESTRGLSYLMSSGKNPFDRAPAESEQTSSGGSGLDDVT
jgi:predicted PurR-regulated permease PerM